VASPKRCAVGFRVRGSNEHNWEYRIVTWVVPSLIGDLPERRIVMTDLNSLMIFAKVVEAKSFSEAARLLKMPTSTVSRRVADLEDQLGVRLLERSTRSLRLTDVGSEVLEHARHTSSSTKLSTTSHQTTCPTSQASCVFLRPPASPTRCLRR
jgi:molybdenum-dependent DNA-binding transcriptional regulator ModE